MATPDDHVEAGTARRDEDEILTDGFREARKPYMVRRREKIREELDRNARGDYKLPTWALLAILITMVVAWVTLIVVA